jgi:hypothetical protein
VCLRVQHYVSVSMDWILVCNVHVHSLTALVLSLLQMVKSFMKQAEGAIREESVNVFIQAVKGTVRLLRDGDFTQDDIDAVSV